MITLLVLLLLLYIVGIIGSYHSTNNYDLEEYLFIIFWPIIPIMIIYFTIGKGLCYIVYYLLKPFDRHGRWKVNPIFVHFR